MITVSDGLFVRDMVDSWQHSDKCQRGRADVCICGLTAIQAMAAKFGRRVFRIALDSE
jgi:hypothetical protein